MKEKIEKIIEVEGMVCEHCTSRVEKELGKMKEVSSVCADLEKKNVTITLKKDIDIEMLKSRITDLGYEVK